MKSFFARHTWKVELFSFVPTLSSLIFYLYLNWQNWVNYRSVTNDLTIFAQEVQSWATQGWPTSTFRGGDGFNRLGDHFSPVNALLAPLWHIWPSTLMLIIVQSVLIAVSVWALTRIAIIRLGSFPGLIFGFCYGGSFAFVATIIASFHEIAWAVPLLTMGGIAYLERKPWASLLWLAPLVFVKEDLGATIALAAIAIAWQQKKLVYLVGVVWGVGWSALEIFVLIPYFNTVGQYDQIIVFTTDHDDFWSPQKLVMIFMFIILTSGLALLSPWSLAVLPTLGWRLLSNTDRVFVPDYWYGATMAAILFIAAIEGYEKLRKRAEENPGKIRTRLPAYATLLMIPFGVGMTANLNHFPDWFAPGSSRVTLTNEVLAQIPAGAIVDTVTPFSDHLVPTNPVYCSADCYTVPGYTPVTPVPDWIILKSYIGDYEDWRWHFGEERLVGVEYEVIEYTDYGLWVGKRIS